MSDSEKPYWVPLESNPDVMTKYIHKMGVPSQWYFEDVLGLDDSLLAMIPQPVGALIILFPRTALVKEANEKMLDQIREEGQEVSANVYFMKQTIGNACGTIGVLHAILNQSNAVFKLGGILADFAEKTKEMTGDERGKYLENYAGIRDAHSSSAQEGQTSAPPAEKCEIPHFIALVHVDGSLYELDGCKDFPINRGTTSPESFLKDAAVVCQKVIDLNPNEVNFNIMALTGGESLFD